MSFSHKDHGIVGFAVLLYRHSENEVLSAKEIREESIMLGLRKQEGITLDGRHLSIPEDKWFISDSIIEEMI